jgi:hypothetical protein
MMDRDYPLHARATLLALVVTAVVGIVVFGGYLPGLKPNWGTGGIVPVDGRTYYYESISVPFPPLGSNTSSPDPFVFHNVTFWIWVTGWYSLAGGQLHGNVSLTNGTEYPFSFQGTPLATGPDELFLAPDGSVGVSWNGGLTALLLVAE